MRTVCYRCDKIESLCVCASVPRVANKTPVTILQHPRERRHPIGTARLLRLGLERMDLRVCWGLTTPPPPGSERIGLLFPSAHAHDLACLEGVAPPEHLVVIDGTWTQAKGLYQANPWLWSVPHFRITPDGTDRYRIRKEPRADYTSTLEATVEALRLIEPETPGFGGLVAAFNTMIGRQVEQITEKRAGPRRLARQRPPRQPIPDLLVQAGERLVVVYVEVRLRRPGPSELVYLTAVRPHTGAVLAEVVLAPDLIPDASHLTHMGLDTAALRAGSSLEDVRRAFAVFCGPDSVIAAWNQTTVEHLERALGPVPKSVILKGVYCNLRRGACGSLTDVVAAEGLTPPDVTCAGRASERLAGAWAMVDFLVANATPGDAATPPGFPDPDPRCESLPAPRGPDDHSVQ